ncbi:MAG TPA: alanine racemase [Candidatus Methanoperedens sp.]|nr:alanine racemase [Candidatus Methanoperedens sp.]
MSPGATRDGSAGRRTRARIDLAAFAHNVRLAVRLAGPGRRVLAVVKADAYGHGAAVLAGAALAAGATQLGVATAGEARALRAAGVDCPILILSEVAPAEAAEVVRLECAQTLYTPALAEALEREAARAGRRVGVHLKIDTGMGRVGVAPAEALPFAARLRDFPHLVLEGMMSHLAEAERAGSPVTARQIASFRAVCGAIEAMSGPVRWRHIANSALLLRGEPDGNLVRPGIMLYGSVPGPGLPQAQALRPVLSLVTEIAFLKRIAAGTPVSYGGTWTAPRESLIATLPIGYADGYRRSLSNRAAVLVRGRRALVVGTVCMDLCLADVTDVPGVAVGDEVLLIGRQGGEEINAGELAERGGTISYEIFCGIGPRVPRLYREGPVGYHGARDGGRPPAGAGRG